VTIAVGATLNGLTADTVELVLDPDGHDEVGTRLPAPSAARAPVRARTDAVGLRLSFWAAGGLSPGQGSCRLGARSLTRSRRMYAADAGV